jgi:hypothetical protein
MNNFITIWASAGKMPALPQHTALVYATMLVVAILAHRFQRPELATSPTRVLADKRRDKGCGSGFQSCAAQRRWRIKLRLGSLA